MFDFKLRNVGVIGAGAWGTIVASLFASKGLEVKIWDRNPKVTKEINQLHINNMHLPGIALPKSLKAVEHLYELLDMDLIVIVVPAQSVREIVKMMHFHYTKIAVPHEKKVFLICAKGLEISTSSLLSEIVNEYFSNEIAVLSGPNFAIDIAKGLPACSVIACKELAIARIIAKAVNSNTFYCEVSDDIKGVQVAGSVKNVLAIATGIYQGLNLGDNAKAALITYGLNEMKLLIKGLGGREETAYSLAGIGDLLLTCSSPTSRNMKFGYEIGQLGQAKKVIASLNSTVEGYSTARPVHALMKKLSINLPICQLVYEVLYEELPVEFLSRVINGKI